MPGHRPHFNYISLGVNHSINHDRAADLGLSGQDRVDRVGRRDDMRRFHSVADANRALRRQTDGSWCRRGRAGKDSAEHAARLSTGNPAWNAVAGDNHSRYVVSVRLLSETSDLMRYSSGHD
jgi:hypothetical protein